MARYLVLDKALYDQDGLVSLFRGDDWEIPGKITDIDGNYSTQVDISDVTGATGYLPGASGGTVAVPVTLMTPKAGDVQLSLSATGTPLVALASGVPIGFYLVLKHPSSQETVRTTDEALNVLDPSFPTG